jgi:hypothetical protein
LDYEVMGSSSYQGRGKWEGEEREILSSTGVTSLAGKPSISSNVGRPSGLTGGAAELSGLAGITGSGAGTLMPTVTVVPP